MAAVRLFLQIILLVIYASWLQLIGSYTLREKPWEVNFHLPFLLANNMYR